MSNTVPIPFYRPSLGEEEISAVSKSLRSGWLTSGPEVEAFEREFSQALGEGIEAVAVNSCTAALHLGLEAMGIGPGDEVIVPTLTFAATAEIIHHLGATPVLADIDPETLCLSAETAQAAFSENTRAIMPVHFAGRPCGMTKLRSFAKEAGLMILEDAAHAFPARHQSLAIGAGETGATAFSFYANKTLTTGEGGMLTTRDPAIAARARTMRLHGIDRDAHARRDRRAGESWNYDVARFGYKYNMTDSAAALGRVQHRRRGALAQARAKIAARYDKALADLPLRLAPSAENGDQHSNHLYPIQILADISRETVITELREAGIEASVHYRPLHQLSVWKEHMKSGTYPNADAYFTRCLSLPIFPGLSEIDQDRIIFALRTILSGLGRK